MQTHSLPPPTKDQDEWICRIALIIASNKTVVSMLKLTNHFPTAKMIFEASDAELSKLVKHNLLVRLRDKNLFAAAQSEYQKSIDDGISFCYYKENNYPNLLKECKDNSILLYKKGNAELSNQRRLLAIVGIRTPSEYGKKVINHIIQELAPYNPIIVSGLAYGIDALAHSLALHHNLKTFAILGSGLKKIYPSSHQNLASSIEKNGALISEYTLHTKPEAYHFPMRNRVIAGMTSGTLVIESAIKGGSMITASLACSYGREVMTIPNSIYQPQHLGCHHLIKMNMAHLIESGKDIAHILGWESTQAKASKVQISINKDLLSEVEKQIVNILQSHEQLHIDNLCNQLNMQESAISLELLQLEMQKIIKRIPGNMFLLV